MFVLDVITRRRLNDTETGIEVGPPAGPELWPIGVWDVLWVALGLLLARLLMLLG